MNTSFYVYVNGKTYDVEMRCRVQNKKGEWETANINDILTDRAVDALCAEMEGNW